MHAAPALPPLRLAGPLRHRAVLAACQAVAIVVLLAYGLALVAAAWRGAAWAASSLGAGAWAGAVPFALGVALAALGAAWPLALMALVGAHWGWHWPWPLAALLALPQLATWLPGLASAGIARLRHG